MHTHVHAHMHTPTHPNIKVSSEILWNCRGWS